MIVLDASAVVELVLGTEAGMEVARHLDDPEVGLHAPHLLDVEVAQVVRRYVMSGAVTEERGRLALESLQSLDVERHGHEALLPRVWDLRENLTAYDAVYVALAEALDADLLTRDQRLANVPGLPVRVVVV